MNSIWRIPAALGVVSTIGLATAIVGDGLWHWICWVGLSIPLGVCVVKLWRQWPPSGIRAAGE